MNTNGKDVQAKFDPGDTLKYTWIIIAKIFGISSADNAKEPIFGIIITNLIENAADNANLSNRTPFKS